MRNLKDYNEYLNEGKYTDDLKSVSDEDLAYVYDIVFGNQHKKTMTQIRKALIQMMVDDKLTWKELYDGAKEIDDIDRPNYYEYY